MGDTATRDLGIRLPWLGTPRQPAFVSVYTLSNLFCEVETVNEVISRLTPETLAGICRDLAGEKLTPIWTSFASLCEAVLINNVGEDEARLMILSEFPKAKV